MIDSSSSENKEGIKNKFLLELWDVVKVFLLALAVVLPLRYYVAQPFIVRGSSMEPNFHDKEYLVVDEISYRFREPKRGETIVLRYPQSPSNFFIKRIVGLPEESLEIIGGEIKINSKKHPQVFLFDEPYLDPARGPTYPDLKINLGQDEYFVLGDNRQFSSDSRAWGPLLRKFIVGRAVFRVLPFSRFGLVPDFSF